MVKSNLLSGWKKHKVSVLFALPFLTLFFVFVVIPVFSAVVISFTRYSILQPPEFVGMQNYLRLFLKDEIFIGALKFTLLFAVVSAPLSMLACLMVAWMINDFSPMVRAVLTFIFYAPSLSGGAIVIWQLIFSGDSYGFANNTLQQLGFISEPIQWLSDTKYMFGILLLVTLWGSLGTGFLSYVAAFRGIDASLYEAAAIDGVKNRIQELWYITIPALRPQMLFSALISITGSFSVGAVSSALFGNPSPNYGAHTIVLHMEDYANVRYELGMACAMATVLFVVTVVANRLVSKFIARIGQ